jgi:hypothetical protein
MEEELCNKLNSLPSKDRISYSRKLTEVLNDSYSSFIYGGISNKEYTILPKEKVEIVEKRLYEEMVENKVIQLA